MGLVRRLKNTLRIRMFSFEEVNGGNRYRSSPGIFRIGEHERVPSFFANFFVLEETLEEKVQLSKCVVSNK